MFNFKKNVKKELNKIWEEIYNNQKFKQTTKTWIDGFDERFAGIQDEIQQIEINYGDCLKNYETKIKQIVNAVNKVWDKQKQVEERQYKIIKVLEKMANKLDQETIINVKNITKQTKGEK